MKRIILFITCGSLVISHQVFAQSSSATNSFVAGRYLGWDGPSGANPLLFRTTGINRMRLNGTQSYTVAGFSQARDGYLLLGSEITLGGDGPLYDRGPFSLLHLSGSDGTFTQQFGHRAWMKTGITFTDNNDMSYFGLRRIGSGNDVTETAVVWSDNNGIGTTGPDDFSFRFTGGNNNSAYNQDLSNQGDLDGLHVARFTGTGLMGLGNTFGVTDGAMLYTRPQSLLHMSYQFREGDPFELYGFHQITYQRALGESTDIIGQGEGATDGLRLGIDNFVHNLVGGNKFLNSYLRWQEASSFIIQTEDNNSPNIESNERIRVTSIGALNLNYGSSYGGLTTAQAQSGITRVGISHNGGLPITKPLSLLHLGYQTYGGGNDGWRKWMDVGIYTSNGTDQVFLGLKPEGDFTTLGDRQDAVLNWGDNITGTGGADNFRMIFTAASGNTSPATSADGLEGLRMTPTTTTGIFTGIGGDPTANTYVGGSINPTATLEVNSWGNTNVAGGSSGLRFTNLNSASPTVVNPGTGVLSVNDNGDVIYVNAPTNPGGNGGFGAACGDNVNGKLQFDTKVDFDNNNMYFVNGTSPMNLDENRMGIGYPCAASLPGKFSVLQLHDQTVPISTRAGHFLNLDVANNPMILTKLDGVYGEASGLQPNNLKTMNAGGSFYAKNAQINYGVRAIAEQGGVGNPLYIGLQNIGGHFEGSFGELTATGVVAQGAEAKQRNIGVSGVGTSPTNPSQIENIGGQFTGAYSAGNNMAVYAVGYGGAHAYGIYATASGGALNHAGYFNGNVEVINGTYISDRQFKTNVAQIEGGLKTLEKLRPVKYYFDVKAHPRFNFGTELQYGFIAQEVEAVLPSLVYQSGLPATHDSLGNEITAATSYKSLNYNGLIPINTQAILDLNRKVDVTSLSDQKIKTNVQDLTGSLNKVLQMRGVSYNWMHNVHPELNLDSANHIGFVAQELQRVDPRLTFVADDNLLHVEYEKVVPVLAEAIKELNGKIASKDSVINAQQGKIDDLNSRLSQLENCLSGILPYLCQLSQSAVKANTPAAQEEVRKNLNVTLKDRNTIILDQNVPNPFAEQTVINFSIPKTVQKAQIHFYDGNGKLLHTVEVTERGLGSLTVFGSDLSTGMYTYTLVADGQAVATKKMIKQ